MIKMIWAQTKSGVIGQKNGMPWKIKAEMAHFTKTTSGQKVLMGGKTFESIGCRPLKNRQNYVVTNEVQKYQDLNFPNLIFLSQIGGVVEEFQGSKRKNIYIIGGNQIFTSFFPYADEIIRTIVYQDYPGDLKISNFDYKDFKLKKIEKKTDFEIQYFERIKNHD